MGSTIFLIKPIIFSPSFDPILAYYLIQRAKKGDRRKRLSGGEVGSTL